ncbi:MAG: ZIP family metal transporter, partial [Bacilli bacterium]|nr:ZIP family metal transporter [Bacilli bacterium]
MNIITPLIICTVAGLGTLIGSLLVFIPKIEKKGSMSLILGFSGTIMILISLLDLLPTSITTIMTLYNVINTTIISIIFFFLGYLIINVLDKKVEKESSLYKVGILSLIGLMLHNFPEGIATFMTSVNDQSLGIKLSIAIMLHNIPEGICI